MPSALADDHFGSFPVIRRYRTPVTSCSHLVVPMALSRLVSDMMTQVCFFAFKDVLAISNGHADRCSGLPAYVPR